MRLVLLYLSKYYSFISPLIHLTKPKPKMLNKINTLLLLLCHQYIGIFFTFEFHSIQKNIVAEKFLVIVTLSDGPYFEAR